MNTELWITPEYSKTGTWEIVRIVYNPYERPAELVKREWIFEEFLHQIKAINKED